MKIATLEYLIQTEFYKLESIIRNIGKPETKKCDICGWHGKYFKSFYNKRTRIKEATICPECNSVDRTRFIYSYLKSEKRKGIKILEPGAGNFKAVTKAIPEAQYVTIDVMPNRAMYQMDLTKLGFGDDTLDIIVCLSVLQNIKNEIDAIKEMYRVLKNGGEVLIWIPIGYYGESQGTKPIEFDKPMFYGKEGVWRSYEQGDFTKTLNSIGFTVEIIPFECNGGYKQESIIFRGVK